MRSDDLSCHADHAETPVYSGRGSAASTLQPRATNDPWDFDLLSPSTSSGKVTPAVVLSPALSQGSKTATNGVNSHSTASKQASVFDLLEADDASAHVASAQDGNAHSLRPNGNPASPSIAQDDDFLGDLGKPVVQKPSSTKPIVVAPTPQRPVSSQATEPPLRAVAARTPSPPPHVLGEIVIMGFSVQQAKLALAATLGASAPNQWDVQAALEVLLSDGAANAQRDNSGPRRSQKPTARRRDSSDEEQDILHDRQTATKAPNSKTGSSQTEDLLSQASSVGASVLKSAGAYWKTGKAQITKAVKENEFLQQQLQARSASSSGRVTPDLRSGGNTPRTGRPKWMTDAEDAESLDDTLKHRPSLEKGKHPAVEFRDDDGETYEQRPPQRSPATRSPKRPVPSKPQAPAASLAADLFDLNPSGTERSTRAAGLAGTERIYSSPNRRSTKPIASASSSQPSQAAPPALKPRPRRPARQFVQCDASLISSSLRSKTAGNDCYKVGQYGKAIEHYTNALAPLPEGHLQRIPILNNRSNARLKNGEEKDACEDATSVLEILLGVPPQTATDKSQYMAAAQEISYYPSGLPPEQAIDAFDALGKALSRRARGNEAREKWADALCNWQLLLEIGDNRVTSSAGGSQVIAAGVARCRKTTEGPASSSPTQRPISKAPPKPKPKPAALRRSSLVSATPSQAVTAMRKDNAQTEADESERIRVKDAIDAKIQAWRGGKETNLRALLASLDTILWPELEWKKVGMHELLTDSQLKIRYMRAIGKVHPDKVNYT